MSEFLIINGKFIAIEIKAFVFYFRIELDQSVSITDDEQMQKLEEELQAKVLIRTVDDENDSDYEDVDDDDEVEKVPIVKKVTKKNEIEFDLMGKFFNDKRMMTIKMFPKKNLSRKIKN